MDNNDFYNWLIYEKKLSIRSAKDVISRCKRVCNHFISEGKIVKDSIVKMNSNEEFSNCSMFIKSQLRRAVNLYLEFEANDE